MAIKNKLQKLKECISYNNMDELKDICKRLKLSSNGKKGDIINRIVTFLETGKIVRLAPLPDASTKHKGKAYPLHPQTLILYGSYKNDNKTRTFMKSLIGEHFHFTAFGQDYIKERWLDSNPPTYQEFADFWKKEFEKRKTSQASPKQEWAYLKFIQNYLKEYPKASQRQITTVWQELRNQKAQQTNELIEYLIAKPIKYS